MGIYTPPPYRVKREGKWVWIYPEPRIFATGEIYVPLDEKSKSKNGGRRSAAHANINVRK